MLKFLACCISLLFEFWNKFKLKSRKQKWKGKLNIEKRGNSNLGPSHRTPAQPDFQPAQALTQLDHPLTEPLTHTTHKQPSTNEWRGLIDRWGPMLAPGLRSCWWLPGGPQCTTHLLPTQAQQTPWIPRGHCNKYHICLRLRTHIGAI